MNLLEVESTSPDEWGGRRALVHIDGRPLLEVVKELEAPLASADGQPDVAGAYAYLNVENVLYPSLLLLGEGRLQNGKVVVLECDCGVADCWPLLMRITADEDVVVWSDPGQPHRPQWRYPADWHLIFARRPYEAALGFPPES